jgi:hypothetical protein
MHLSTKILLRRLVGLAVLIGAFAETPGWTQSAADPVPATADPVRNPPFGHAARG